MLTFFFSFLLNSIQIVKLTWVIKTLLTAATCLWRIKVITFDRFSSSAYIFMGRKM